MSGEEMRLRLAAIGIRTQTRASKALGRSQGTVCELFKKREVPRSVAVHVQALETIYRLKRTKYVGGVIMDA